jgi:hypothetical protein
VSLSCLGNLLQHKILLSEMIRNTKYEIDTKMTRLISIVPCNVILVVMSIIISVICICESHSGFHSGSSHSGFHFGFHTRLMDFISANIQTILFFRVHAPYGDDAPFYRLSDYFVF